MARSSVLYPIFSSLLLLSLSADTLNAQGSNEINWMKRANIDYPLVAARSDDGTYIAAVNRTGEIMVWQDGFAHQFAFLSVPVADTPTISFTQGGEILVVAAGGDVFFLDVRQQNMTGTLQFDGSDILALIPVDQRKMLVLHGSGVVHEIDPQSRTLLATWMLPFANLQSFRLIDNGSVLLFVDQRAEGDTLRAWDLQAERLLPFRLDLDGPPHQYAGSPGSTVVAFTNGSKLSVFDVRTSDTVYSEWIAGAGDTFFSIGISRTGDSLFYFDGREGGMLVMWGSDQREELDLGNIPLVGPMGFPPFLNSPYDARRIDFSSDGKRVLLNVFGYYSFASAGYQLLLYDFDRPGIAAAPGEGGENVYVLPGDNIAVVAGCCKVDVESGEQIASIGTRAEEHYRHYSRNGMTVVIGDEVFESGLSGTVTVLGPYKSWVAWDHYEHPPYPYDVSPDGRYLLLTDGLHFADSTFSERKILSPGFLDARFAFDGYHFAGTRPDRIDIWDCRTLSIVNRISVDPIPIVVEFSKESDLVAAGFGDGRIEVYDPFTGDKVAALEGHRGKVRDLSFTRKGRFLVSVAEDSTVRTWKLETGTNDYTYESYPSKHISVSTTSDGQYILTTAEDGTVICWNGKGEISSVGRDEGPVSATAALDAAVTPNPTGDGSITLSCNVDEPGRLGIHIYNVNGEQVYGMEDQVGRGRLAVPVRVDQLTQGRYTCRVVLLPESGGESRERTLPVVIVR